MCKPHRQGRLEQAIAAYEQALAAAPNLQVVQLNLAAALTQYGTQAKAAGDVPSLVLAWRGLGRRGAAPWLCGGAAGRDGSRARAATEGVLCWPASFFTRALV